MAAKLIHEVLLTEVGTNKIHIRVEDFQVWFTIIDKGNPQEPFFTMNKSEWKVVKKFVDSLLTENNVLDISPTTNELDKW